MEAIIENNLPQVDYKKMQRAIYGKLTEILADIYIQKMNSYRLIIGDQINDLKRIIVLITVIFQVPILPTKDASIINEKTETWFENAINHNEGVTEDIQHAQIDSNIGWSKFTTLSLQHELLSLQDLTQSQRVVSELLGQLIMQQARLMIEGYGNDDNGLLTASVIAHGFKHAMIRQVTIRPLSIFNDSTRNQLLPLQ